MIYRVDVEGNLLEFVVYFLDGQFTDGDDHCVALDDDLLLIGWCNKHVGYGHGKSGDAGHDREHGQVRDDCVLFLEMYNCAILIKI